MNIKPTIVKRTVALTVAIAATGTLGLGVGSASARVDVPTPHAERPTSVAAARPSSSPAVSGTGQCPRISLRGYVACAW